MKWIIIVLLIFLSCISKVQKIEKETKTVKQKINCNYYWPLRKVHVCIKDIDEEECNLLFASERFLKEDECYCDKHNKEKNIIKGTGYIQYDCQ